MTKAEELADLYSQIADKKEAAGSTDYLVAHYRQLAINAISSSQDEHSLDGCIATANSILAYDADCPKNKALAKKAREEELSMETGDEIRNAAISIIMGFAFLLVYTGNILLLLMIAVVLLMLSIGVGLSKKNTSKELE